MELPKSFQYVDVGDDMYRVNFTCPEDTVKWVAEYSKNTGSVWLLFRNICGKRIFRKSLYCRYSSHFKKKDCIVRNERSLNTDCPAQIHIIIKKKLPGCMRRDKYIKMGYCGIIKFKNCHNHSQSTFQNPIKDKFFSYFEQGLGVSESLAAYKSECNLLSEIAEFPKMDLKYKPVYWWYQKWKNLKRNSNSLPEKNFLLKPIKSNCNYNLSKLFSNKIKNVELSDELRTILFNSLLNINKPADWDKLIKKPKLPIKATADHKEKQITNKNHFSVIPEKSKITQKDFIFDHSDGRLITPIFDKTSYPINIVAPIADERARIPHSETEANVSIVHEENMNWIDSIPITTKKNRKRRLVKNKKETSEKSIVTDTHQVKNSPFETMLEKFSFEACNQIFATPENSIDPLSNDENMASLKEPISTDINDEKVSPFDIIIEANPEKFVLEADDEIFATSENVDLSAAIPVTYTHQEKNSPLVVNIETNPEKFVPETGNVICATPIDHDYSITADIANSIKNNINNRENSSVPVYKLILLNLPNTVANTMPVHQNKFHKNIASGSTSLMGLGDNRKILIGDKSKFGNFNIPMNRNYSTRPLAPKITGNNKYKRPFLSNYEDPKKRKTNDSEKPFLAFAYQGKVYENRKALTAAMSPKAKRPITLSKNNVQFKTAIFNTDLNCITITDQGNTPNEKIITTKLSNMSKLNDKIEILKKDKPSVGTVYKVITPTNQGSTPNKKIGTEFLNMPKLDDYIKILTKDKRSIKTVGKAITLTDQGSASNKKITTKFSNMPELDNNIKILTQDKRSSKTVDKVITPTGKISLDAYKIETLDEQQCSEDEINDFKDIIHLEDFSDNSFDAIIHEDNLDTNNGNLITKINRNSCNNTNIYVSNKRKRT